MLDYGRKSRSQMTLPAGVALGIAGMLLIASFALPPNKAIAAAIFFELPTAAVAGIGLAIAAWRRERLARSLALLATAVSLIGMIVVALPTLSWIALAYAPPRSVPPDDAQRGMDEFIRWLHVSPKGLAVIKAEERGGPERRHYAMIRAEPALVRELKARVISGAQKRGWQKFDDSDARVSSPPHPSQPDWFDTRAYADADALRIGYHYDFIFCPSAGTVFFCNRNP